MFAIVHSPPYIFIGSLQFGEICVRVLIFNKAYYSININTLQVEITKLGLKDFNKQDICEFMSLPYSINHFGKTITKNIIERGNDVNDEKYKNRFSY
jgi:hypothetical protein